MNSEALKHAFIVSDPATARIFADSPKRRLLLGFVDQPHSVSEAARASGEPLGRVHYHVTDLCRRGLLEVVREEKRKGRPIKHYRAVSAKFFVPIELVSRSPGAGLAAELRARLDEEALKSDEEGLLFTTEQGRPRIFRISDGQRRRPFGEFWYIYNMTQADAEELSQELDALFRRYHARSSDKGQPYLFHAAFASRRRG